MFRGKIILKCLGENNYKILDHDDAECHEEDTGFDYRGVTSTTVNDHTCFNWNTVSSFGYEISPEKYPEAGIGDHNYCRNPDAGDDGAWCYTSDPSEHYWEYCDIGSPKPPCLGMSSCFVSSYRDCF